MSFRPRTGAWLVPFPEMRFFQRERTGPKRRRPPTKAIPRIVLWREHRVKGADWSVVRCQWSVVSGPLSVVSCPLCVIFGLRSTIGPDNVHGERSKPMTEQRTTDHGQQTNAHLSGIPVATTCWSSKSWARTKLPLEATCSPGLSPVLTTTWSSRSSATRS
jgi:hypothetical protein